MQELLSWFLIILSSFTSTYLLTKILDRNYDGRFFLFFLCMIPAFFLITSFLQSFSFFFFLILFTLGILLFYRETLQRSIYTAFFYLCWEMFFELLFLIVLSSLCNITFQKDILLQIFFQVFSFCGLFFFLKTRFATKIRHFLLQHHNSSYIPFFLFFFFIILFQLTYFQNETLDIKTLGFLFCSSNFGIILLFFLLIHEKETEKNLKLEFDHTLKYAMECEELLDTSRKNQHEFCNQLLYIKSISKEKNVQEFIKRILKQEQEDLDHELMEKLTLLPFELLRGLLYYKFMQIKKQSISLHLEVSPNIKKTKSITKKDCEDIAQILAIYLDNAMEATRMAEEQNISVAIFMGKNDNLVCSIANTFQSNLDIEKILKNHRTTKGLGHGHGLLIAEEILKGNPKLKQETEWISNIFIQNIKISL